MHISLSLLPTYAVLAVLRPLHIGPYTLATNTARNYPLRLLPNHTCNSVELSHELPPPTCMRHLV
jgi:hypothetical protein